jgi:hypothetical protein
MSRAPFVITLASIGLTSPLMCADNVDLAWESLHSICVADGPDFERIVASAKELGWTPLSGDAFADLAPVGPVNAFQAWKATGAAMPAKTMVGVTKATLNGKAVQTCSVTLFDVDRAAFEKRFFDKTDAEKIEE